MNLKTAAFLAIPVGLASAFAFVPRPNHGGNPALEFVGKEWSNVPGEKPSLAHRNGKPTLVAFWTFACSNCQANLPSYTRLYAKYKVKGVELVAIHTPELPMERDPKAVAEHIRRFRIDYPVLLDGRNENWNRWGVRVWPTLFVVDGTGHIRGKWEGELQWQGANGEGEVAALLDRLLAAS